MFQRFKYPLVLCCLSLFLFACANEDVDNNVQDLEGAADEVAVVREQEVVVEVEVTVEVEKEVESYDDSADDADYASVPIEDADEEVAMARPRPTQASQPTNEPTVQAERPEDDPDNMTFEDERENRFVDTRDDNLSTFAIDVDTGSYTVHRSYLNEYGAMPDSSSIRVEEFVNFFDYGYAPPEEASFAIYHEAAPAPYSESDNYHLLRVGIQGYEVPDDERPPVLLIFVIDVSGSMEGYERLGLVKDSLKLLVNALNDDDRVGIVVYGSNSRVVLSPTAASDNREITDAIDNLRTEGATNADAGIEEAYRMADKFRLSDEQARLIVLSDGVANVGRTTADAVLENAKRGISLSTFGFGMGNYNDTFMEQLSNDGDGTYAYIDTLREAERVFVNDMTGTLLTIAKDAKIQVEFNPEVVERYRLLGYENRDVADEDFRNDTVDAGEIGAGHSVTALYEVRLADDAAADDVAMTTYLRYEDARTGDIVEIEKPFSPVEITTSYDNMSDSFKLSAMVAEYAELLRESFWAETNTLESVWQDAQSLRPLATDDDEVDELLALMERAAGFDKGSR